MERFSFSICVLMTSRVMLAIFISYNEPVGKIRPVQMMTIYQYLALKERRKRSVDLSSRNELAHQNQRKSPKCPELQVSIIISILEFVCAAFID